MTHRGPFQPLLFCDSVIQSSACGTGGRSAAALGVHGGQSQKPGAAGLVGAVLALALAWETLVRCNTVWLSSTGFVRTHPAPDLPGTCPLLAKSLARKGCTPDPLTAASRGISRSCWALSSSTSEAARSEEPTREPGDRCPSLGGQEEPREEPCSRPLRPLPLLQRPSQDTRLQLLLTQRVRFKNLPA